MHWLNVQTKHSSVLGLHVNREKEREMTKWSTNREKQYYSNPNIFEARLLKNNDKRTKHEKNVDGQTHFHAYDISADNQICKFNLP